MNLVLKYLALFTAILKRGLACPQAKAMIAVMESTPETVEQTSILTNLQAYAEKNPDKASDIAIAREILDHIMNPVAA